MGVTPTPASAVPGTLGQLPDLASQGQTVADRSAVLRHRVFSSFAQAEPLRAAWEELAQRCGDLFASYDWCRTWWRYYGGKRRLQIHVVHDGADLVAVLPLFRETVWPLGVPLRVIRLVGSDHALTPAGLAIQPEYVRPVFRGLLQRIERQGHWDLLHLGPLLFYMDTVEVMAEVLAAQPTVGQVISNAQGSCVTVYDLPQTYEQYLGGLGSERRNILRCERNATSQQQVQASVPTTQEDVRKAMAELVRLHQHLWIGKGKLGQFRDWPDYERFHCEMAEHQVQAGRLALVTVQAGSQTIGVEYGYHFGARTHALIRGYCDDQTWRTYSIGRMLHCHMVQQAIGRGSTLLDDGRGVFEYKRRLGGRLRCERSLTVVRSGVAIRSRIWLAMRSAWCIHAVYGRIWFDWLRPRLGLPARPLRCCYIRTKFLAHLLKRTRFTLHGVRQLEHVPYDQAGSACSLAAPVQPSAVAAAEDNGQARVLTKKDSGTHGPLPQQAAEREAG